MTAYRIRPATVADAPVILRFIRELAEYEKALHEVAATEETVAASIFGAGSVTRAAICETAEGEPAGFAVWFKSYSTWQAKNGLYLEDLYVTPDHRGGGVGKIFHLGKLPVNTQLSAYYNVVTPDDGANWQIRAQVQFMFPK